MTEWEGDILAYKEHLKTKVLADMRRLAKAQKNGGAPKAKSNKSNGKAKW